MIFTRIGVSGSVSVANVRIGAGVVGGCGGLLAFEGRLRSLERDRDLERRLERSGERERRWRRRFV